MIVTVQSSRGWGRLAPKRVAGAEALHHARSVERVRTVAVGIDLRSVDGNDGSAGRLVALSEAPPPAIANRNKGLHGRRLRRPSF